MTNAAQAALEEIAARVQEDTRATYPEMKLDDNYDLWIEELRNSRGDRQTIGVIQMGDVWSGVFSWDGKEWHEETYSAYAMVQRILREREYTARLWARDARP